jgi:hypothetical protein
VNVRWNAAAVIRNRYRLVGVDRDHDAIAMARQRLVDGVVHDFENHVMEAGAIIGVTDVHAGPLSHRIETLQDLDFA